MQLLRDMGYYIRIADTDAVIKPGHCAADFSSDYHNLYSYPIPIFPEMVTGQR